MILKKSFPNTKFKTETIRLAQTYLQAQLNQLRSPGKEYPLYQYGLYTLQAMNGDRWTYNTPEEFFNVYQNEVKSSTFEIVAGDFGFTVAYYQQETDMTVKASDRSQLDALMNLFIEAGDNSKTIATDQINISPTRADMPSFETSKRLPSCHVDKNLVQNLEIYLLKEASIIAGISEDELKNGYTITLIDQSGTDILKSASQIEGSRFSDTTSRLTLSIDFYNQGTRLNIDVQFDKAREHSRIRLTITLRRARELASSLIVGIERKLSPSTTRNWMYLSNIDFFGPLFFPLIALPALFLIPLFNSPSYKPFGHLLLLCIIIEATYLYGGMFVKHYTTFDTPSQTNRDTMWGFVVGGAVIFVLYDTIFTGWRQKIFGF